jgi:hypothetical protein
MDDTRDASRQAELHRELPTRPLAMAEFWRLSQQVAHQIAALRQLQHYISQRWGRAPRLPKW